MSNHPSLIEAAKAVISQADISHHSPGGIESVDVLYPAIAQLRAALSATPDAASADGAGLCEWLGNDDGTWNPSCDGEAFIFNDGGPLENKFRFCPYCAKPIGEFQEDTTPTRQESAS